MVSWLTIVFLKGSLCGYVHSTGICSTERSIGHTESFQKKIPIIMYKEETKLTFVVGKLCYHKSKHSIETFSSLKFTSY